jgi:hypothetical protein
MDLSPLESFLAGVIVVFAGVSVFLFSLVVSLGKRASAASAASSDMGKGHEFAEPKIAVLQERLQVVEKRLAEVESQLRQQQMV